MTRVRPRTISIPHLGRVEGHGGIFVELAGDTVVDVNMDIHEGSRYYEALLLGKDFREVQGIITRVCAICSANHTVAALQALERALGIPETERSFKLRGLMLRGDGMGRFEVTESVLLGATPERSDLADFDGDGFADLVTPLGARSSVSYISGAANGLRGTPRELIAPRATAFELVDFDGDERPDRVAVDPRGDRVLIEYGETSAPKIL